MKLSLLLTVLLCAPAGAAPDKTPKGPPKPAVPARAAAGELDAAVEARIEAFFKNLAAGKVEEAYGRLFEGSTLAKEQTALLPTLIKNTAQLLEKCGAAEGGAVLRVRGAGRTLREVTCILNCRKQPVRWTLYVYYGEGRWQVLDADADLDLSAFFETDKTAAGR